MSEPLTKDLIQHALDQDFNKANDVFGEILNIKISDVLDQEKIKLSGQIYNGEEPEEDPDEEQMELDLEYEEEEEVSETEDSYDEEDDGTEEIQEPSQDVEEPMGDEDDESIEK